MLFLYNHCIIYSVTRLLHTFQIHLKTHKCSTLPHRQKNYPVRLCRRIKNRGFKIHMHNLNNDQTSIIWSHIIFNKLLSKTYRFRVIGDLLNVVGWQKVRFWQKVCKNRLIKKIKTDFFFESLITHKRSILSIVMFHMINVKRVVL